MGNQSSGNERSDTEQQSGLSTITEVTEEAFEEVRWSNNSVISSSFRSHDSIVSSDGGTSSINSKSLHGNLMRRIKNRDPHKYVSCSEERPYLPKR